MNRVCRAPRFADLHTATVVESFADRDPRVKYVRHAANIGMVANLNTVIRLGSGKYRMWLADDDWIDDDLVGRCCELLESEPELAMVAGRCREYRNGIDEGARVPTNLLSEPYLAAAVAAYRDIARKSPALEQWSAGKRRLLALSVFAVLLTKKVLLRRIYLGMQGIIAYVYAGRVQHDD